MARTARAKGNVVPHLRLTGLSNANGGVTAITPSDDLVSVEYGDGEGEEALTFSDVAEGKVPMSLTVSATWSGERNSLYHVLQANAGRAGVAFEYGRLGNAVAATGKPLLTGTVKLPPTFGWSAEAGDETDTFECELQIESGAWTHV